MKSNYSRYILSALFAALFAISAQICIPMPSGTPLTLQTLAVSLSAFILGAKFSCISTAVYLLLGLFGAPVFAHFGAGPAVLFGKNGGYLLGLIFLGLCCGISSKANVKWIKITICLLGVILLHIMGVIYFAFIFKTDVLSAFLLSSMPFILKDILCVLISYFAAIPIKQNLVKSGLSH